MLLQGADEPVWRYIDPDGQVQGPFSAREMHTWYESNYLQMELPICGMVSCHCTHMCTLPYALLSITIVAMQLLYRVGGSPSAVNFLFAFGVCYAGAQGVSS